MARTVLLDTHTANLSDVFSNGKIYRVPIFQRDYSWEQDHWEDLWTDIKAVATNDHQHYMGSLVLQTSDRKNYVIIDGQQRMTTLSIVILAALKNLQDLIDTKVEVSQNNERREELRKYLGSKDAVSLNYSSKLFLNENNDSFYQGYLLQLKAPPAKSKLNASEKLMLGAYDFFRARIKEFLGNTLSGPSIANFVVNELSEKLLFIQIVVEDELNAYTVFETLNARGVELTSTDLLKNYLLSLSAKSPLDQKLAKERWRKMTQLTGLAEFPKFLRYYWNSRYPLVRNEHLFKSVRGLIKTPEQSFTLLDDLDQFSFLYAALSNPFDEFWDGDKKVRNYVRILKAFNVSQCFPLLFSAYMQFSLSDFIKILRFCVIISFRYNVIGGLTSNTPEDIYNKAAQKVFSGELLSPAKVAEALMAIYPSDEEFENSFATKDFDTGTGRGKKMARYILFEIENHLAATDRDYEDDTGTIEHILPENPDNTWLQDFNDEAHQNNVYRLGNLTLLEKKLYRDCENKNYIEKQPIYQSSQYSITQKIQFNQWTQQQIRSRQEQLAKIATGIWRI